MRFHLQTVFVLLLICVCIVIVVKNDFISYDSLQMNDVDEFVKSNRTKILIWSPSCARSYCPQTRMLLMRVHSLCGKQCIFFHDPELQPKANAILFSPFYRTFKKMRYPPRTDPKQIFVFYEREPPIRYPPDPQLPLDYFNATATFHLTSDIPIVYGQYLPQQRDISEIDFRKRLLFKVRKFKKKQAFIVFSHCKTQSRREEMITKLQKYMTINLFGHCTNSTCNKACFEHKTKYHRFYMAFENSFCKDYVSEKFWRFNELVPVVLSRQYYPKVHPKSFIALDDFNSLKSAAEYLNYLQRNDSAYVDHLMWTFTHRRQFLSTEKSLCKVCHYVAAQNLSIPHFHHRIEEYQNRSSTCDLRYQLRWLQPVTYQPPL